MSHTAQRPGFVDQLGAATESGTTTAVAAICQRDLLRCAVAYPDLFPDNPFDATLFNAITLANAFGSPGLSADRLAIANRTTLWIFAVDWLIDYVMDSRDAVHGVVSQICEVIDGGSPESSLTRFLAEIQQELASAPAYPGLRPLWRDQLLKLMDASRREWEWKTARASDGRSALPTLDEYLRNADNFGSTLVNVSHWIYIGDTATFENLSALLAVSDEVQQVLRLLNDLATYKRDLEWGDLNALMLGVSRDQVLERVAALIDNARDLLVPLTDRCPREATYLERQIGYSIGFYGITDYWGKL